MKTPMTQTYTHSPKPFGGPISFTLKGDRLTVDSGRKVHEVQLGAVETRAHDLRAGTPGAKGLPHQGRS